MNRIEIEVASKGLYILRYLLSIAVAFTTAFFIAPPQENSKLIFLLAAAPGYLIFEQLTKKLYVGKMIMEMNKEGLKFIWTKQIIFHNKPNISLQWSEISEYSYDSSTHLDQFVLKLKNGKKVKFFFRFMEEEFMNFYHNMQELTGLISQVDDSVHISRTIGFFETEFGKWLVFGFGVLILSACGLILKIRDWQELNWFGYIVLKIRDWQELNWFGYIVLLIMGLAMVIPRIRHLTSKDVSSGD
ncbi:MAG: hypothetical protein AAFQ94_25615 [Bacteroidota bacterium]